MNQTQTSFQEISGNHTGNQERVISLHQVKKVFETDAGPFTALKNISIDFNRGEFIGVTGKSGSGKSTLINMITGIDHPSDGEIRVGDIVLNQLSESDMARWRGKNLGIVFQFYQLLPMLSLFENILLPMDLSDVIPFEEREERAMWLLERVGLEAYADKMPSEISGGQQQTVAVARSMANDPSIVIADEPTGNLDSKTAERVFSLFEQMKEEGKTIIMITHDPALANRTSRQVVISDGEIIHPLLHQHMRSLAHPLLLQATHALQSVSIEPGQPLFQSGESIDDVYFVENGMVSVWVENNKGQREEVARLDEGNVLGEIEMLRNLPAQATIIPTNGTSVQLQKLSRSMFSELLEYDAVVKTSFSKLAQDRFTENQRVRATL
ncbi:MAG: ATP-binding cassette domain-containing protein [Anaerolineaceae bacterium]|nr:ATP-binding cassette domain-containing protein [Anaerolineaceae bacterium]